MALSVGELVATVDLDDRGMVMGLAGAEAGMHHLGATAISTGEQIHRGLEEAVSELPEVTVDADTTPADRELAALRQRLQVLSHQQIGVDVSTEEAQRDIESLRDRLTVLSGTHPDVTVQAQVQHAIDALNATLAVAGAVATADPTVTVHASTTAATAALAGVTAAATAVGHLDPTVDVHVDDHGSTGGVIRSLGSLASSAFSAAGSVAGFLKWPAILGAAIPIAGALASALVNIIPAAAAAATAVVALVSAVGAVKLGTSGIGGALKAAFAPAVSGGGGAAKATNAVADAQRNLQRATENAAYANRQAAQGVASAERDLTSAQKAALAAQAAVNDARQQATRDLQDMNNSLIDARYAEEDAQNAVEDAAAALSQAKLFGNPEEISRAQLAYDKAQQALREQQLTVSRLTVDTAAANKAGVEGSKTVKDAKASEAQAVQAVADKTLALANAQEQQQRTAQQGLDQIRQAREALAQAGAAGAGGAGGVDAFAQAMAQLAPSARAFVREIIALKPAWDAMKLDVQQRLFAGLAAALAAAAATDLPILRGGLDATAGALNGMARGVLAAAQGLGRSGVLGQALDGAAAGLRNLVSIPGQVVTAFGQIAAAGAPLFQRLTASLGKGADSLADRISTAFTSGGMAQAIDQAARLIGQIGTVLGNVGSIIGSVMSAASDAGGGWLGVLGDISAALKVAFASPEVQAGLHALFDTMATLGQTLAPLLVQALGVIAPVLATLGPPAQELVRSLGAALAPIIKALGPILLAAAQAVGKLVDALSPLLPIIGDLIAALLPILMPVLDLLTSVFADLAAPIKQIATALGSALKPVIKGLTTVMQDLVDRYLDIFLGLLNQLIPLIPVLVPVVQQLGKSLGQVLEALAPLLPQFAELELVLISQLLPAIIPLIPPLAQLTTMLLILATDVITGVVVPVLAGLVEAMNGILTAVQTVADWVGWLVKEVVRLFQWLFDVLVGHSIIPDLIRSIVSWFTGLPGKVLGAIAALPRQLAAVMVDATNRMIAATSTGLKAVVSWLHDLPGRAVNAVGDLGGVLVSAGKSLMNGLIGGITSKISSLTGTLKHVTDLIPLHKGPPGKDAILLRPAGRLIMGGLVDGITDGETPLQRKLAAISGGLSGMALGSAGGALAGAGAYGGGVSATSGGGVQTIRIEVSGPEEVKRLIRTIVQRDGGGGSGSVQRAFG